MKLAHYRIDVITGKVRTVPGIAAFLGQKGIPLNEFVTFMDTNLITKYKEGTIVPVVVVVTGTLGAKDFKYNFILKLPKTTTIYTQIMNARRKVSYKWLYIFAKERQKNNANKNTPLWFICKTLIGTLHSMAGTINYIIYYYLLTKKSFIMTKNSLQKIGYAIYGLECYTAIKKTKKSSKQFSFIIPYKKTESENQTMMDMSFFKKKLNPNFIFPVTQTSIFNIFINKNSQNKKCKISFARWIAFYSNSTNTQNKLHIVTQQYFMFKPYLMIIGEAKIFPKIEDKTFAYNTTNYIFLENATTHHDVLPAIKKQVNVPVYVHSNFSLYKIIINFINMYESQKTLTQTKKNMKKYIFSCDCTGSGFIFFLFALFIIYYSLCLLFFYCFFTFNLNSLKQILISIIILNLNYIQVIFKRNCIMQ